MRIAFFGTRSFDKLYFEPMFREHGDIVRYFEAQISDETVVLARGCEAICVSSVEQIDEKMADKLLECGIRLILLRSKGYGKIDVDAVEKKIPIAKVENYSAESAAEYSVGLLLTVNRQIHRAYARTRDYGASVAGLLGFNIYGKTVGVIGTGEVGKRVIEMYSGFKANVIAYDINPDPRLDVKYVSFDELIEQSDIITIHCPVNENSRNMINADVMRRMKNGIVIVNTSNQALINLEDLEEMLRIRNKIGAVAMDLFADENSLTCDDFNYLIDNEDIVSRLAPFNNVLLTSHLSFFTKDTLEGIAKETIANIDKYK